MIKEVIMPKLGETMEEGYLASWKKEEGEKVEKGDVLFEVMSDKTNFEVESLHEGYLRKQLFQPSDDPIDVTTVIGYITDTLDEPLPEVSSPKVVEQQVTETEEPTKDATEVSPLKVEQEKEEVLGETRLKASPLARRVAEDANVDISVVVGTGPEGRIEKDDVLKYIEEQKQKPEVKPKGSAEYEVIPWTPLRKIISEKLTESKKTIPHFYFQGKLFIDEIIRVKEIAKKNNIDLTYTDFLVFFLSRAIQKYPLINGSVEANEIRVYESVDIGLAVSINDGLIVPVLRDCVNKGIEELSKEIKSVASKARENKLSANDVKGARFIISNLGMYGVDNFQPIISPPGVAIMGVGSINKEPVVISGSVEVRSVMNVSFSFDHRVIDGSYAGLFYSYFKKITENPSLHFFLGKV
ncbi:2-oxo acid dehydrogenase subunit E2 [bacterium]|nr:2-oxo acid dehydrogenase subunit E2 [bacterium]